MAISIDDLFAAWMDRTIRQAQRRPQRDETCGRLASDKLRLLFAGYNGTRNTGSDVRVEEMIRQVRHLFGADRVDITVFSFIRKYSQGYFAGVRQVSPETLFPRFLAREVPRYHGVLACEGSTFKSRFTDLLTVMFVGALGLATAHGRMSIAYGAEAGVMNAWPKRLTADYCKESLILTRNGESRSALAELGVPSELGTDTAWTFSPAPDAYATDQLREVGWNGEPVLMVCPVNPFCWPVKASLQKGVQRLFGAHRASHYGSVFFFNSNEESERRFESYLTSLANAIVRFRQRRSVFVVVAASEEIDNPAMRRLSAKLGGAPMFSSSQYNMYQLVSLFRAADFMLSSRYHAIVTSMAGHVASAGISMDERIVNLMRDRGHEKLLLMVDDPNLEDRSVEVLDELFQNADAIVSEARQTVARNLKVMSKMGRRLVDYVVDRHPAFEPSLRFDSWESYLSPLSLELQVLLSECAIEPCEMQTIAE
ncbi:polysaccharide pyruvyl transferase family protein [Schlesneria paludicola]|uniref:polysaccharide pyruvyl transferase family protein n=1 Tax=Schlesneria paludicola TaxID=360056 RepID=UPI00029AB1F2|nr:polysaccharide pyruvyl transferase family protein [Schlesneria paludicola]